MASGCVCIRGKATPNPLLSLIETNNSRKAKGKNDTTTTPSTSR